MCVLEMKYQFKIKDSNKCVKVSSNGCYMQEQSNTMMHTLGQAKKSNFNLNYYTKITIIIILIIINLISV